MRYVFLICMTLVSQACFAKLNIQDAYARSSRGPNSAIFMTIQNTGKEDVLLGASVSPGICKTVELHTHIQEGDVFKMRAVEALPIPAHGQLILKPGAEHIMLMQLEHPLEEGQMIPLTLQFKHQGIKTLSVPVRSIARPATIQTTNSTKIA